MGRTHTRIVLKYTVVAYFAIRLCFLLFVADLLAPEAHKEEDDQERLAHLLDKGEQNLRFVLRKYKMVEPRPPELPLTTTTTTERNPKTMRRRRRASNTLRAAGEREGPGLAEGESSRNDSTWTPGR